jgi:hypothetical protein
VDGVKVVDDGLVSILASGGVLENNEELEGPEQLEEISEIGTVLSYAWRGNSEASASSGTPS